MPETFHAGPNLGRLSDVTIIHGDCLDALAELAADSVDAIVTDPPYGLGFMGKHWDELPPGLDWAKQCLRVLKPGGHLLAFGGTRTWHRLAVAIEDAGFEIRDSIAWLYGSGFPKSLDVSKAIDKAAGATPIDTGIRSARHGGGVVGAGSSYEIDPSVPNITRPATPEAAQWSGWGTALKPAHEPVVHGVKPYRDKAPSPAFEPVVVARKPLGKGTVAANMLQHGTGALNIDATRIGTTDDRSRPPAGGMFMFDGFSTLADLEAAANRGEQTPKGRDARATLDRFLSAPGSESHTAGRWPANVVLDADQAAALDEQSGTLKSGDIKPYADQSTSTVYGGGNGWHAGDTKTSERKGDSGGASRFFFNAGPSDPPFRYVAKAPKKERPTYTDADGKQQSHATVKPLALMRWLVRLVTPPGGIVLDPFAGSGTTVEAALLEDFRVIGIEREADYLPMIQQRIARCLDC